MIQELQQIELDFDEIAHSFDDKMYEPPWRPLGKDGAWYYYAGEMLFIVREEGNPDRFSFIHAETVDELRKKFFGKGEKQ